MIRTVAIVLCIIPTIGLGQLTDRAKDSMELFAPTPEGKPVGEKISKMIGAEGGQIISPDHSIELTIPAGALSENTNISFTPSTNLSLDGVGNAYHLEPSGLQFKLPATLVFHYDSKTLKENSPELLAIVFQDEKGS